MRRVRVAATLVIMCAASSGAPAQSDNPQAAPARRTPGGAQDRAPQSAAGAEMQKAVDEFKTITRELGLRSDGAKRKDASLSMRADWHGRVFENFRNDFLDAIPHEVFQRGATKSTLRRNQFGFNIAGPLIIPRLYPGSRNTYFSLSYEGVRENIARSLLRTIPTAAERLGDWNATVDAAGNPLPIYDPESTRPNPAYDASRPVSLDNLQYLRQTFPENRIPAGRIDSVARHAVAYYPEPNTAAGPFFRNNYFIHSPERNVANGMIAKLDHTVRERHRASIGLSYSNGLMASAKYFPTAANPGPADRNFRSRHGSLEYVFTASARTVNTATFEASTDGSDSGAGDGEDYPAALGLRGSPGKQFPFFQFGSYLGMGQWAPVSRNVRNTFVWTDSFSTRRGKHGIRIIGQYARHQVNTFWPGSPSGYFEFSPGLTSLPGIVNTGHSFASFLLGLADYSSLTIVGSPSYFRNGSSRLAYRHTYEAAKGLNLSFGLNLDTTEPRTEKYNRQSTVDLGAMNPANDRPGALIFAARDGQGSAFKPALTKLEPSASLAWNPGGDPKTVLRAAYSRSYGAIPVYFGQWGTQGFNGTPTFISPNTQLAPAVVLSDGIPPLSHPLPDLRPDAANDTWADLADASERQPSYQSASLSVEREMPGSVVLTVGLGHAGGRDLWVSNGSANPNAIPPDALRFRDQLNDEEFNSSLRPYPQYKGFELNSSWPRGRYERDAASVRVEKRASAGLTLSAYYEFSKQLDDYSGPYGTQDFYNSRNEWSLTPYNTPHRISLSYAYELPIGSSKRLFAFSDWRRYLVDGWSISGMSTFYSGEPLALRPMFNNTGGVVQALHVDVVPGADPRISNPGPDLWFNPAAFEQPADFTVGDASRTHPFLRNPASQNHDLSLTKRFALVADRAIEFSAVGLNFLNHANWNDPDTVIGPASAPNVNAGKIIGSRGGRVIQLGVRVTF